MAAPLPCYASSLNGASSSSACKPSFDRSRKASSSRRRPSALLRAIPQTWAPRPLPKVSVPRLKIQDAVTAARPPNGLSLSHFPDRKSSDETGSRCVYSELEGLIYTYRDDLSRFRYAQGHGLPGARRQGVSLVKLEEEELDETTYIIRVHDGNGGREYTYPCHAILLATEFASIGPIDGPRPQPKGTQHVVDLVIPHPELFFILRDYMYSHSIDQLMKSLLAPDDSRLPADGRSARVDEVAQAFATVLTGPELISRSYLVYATHQNASHLGLTDATFWQSINLAWAVTTRALQLWRASEL
jgi:hypothetical protein